jgi:hypothetical protein
LKRTFESISWTGRQQESRSGLGSTISGTEPIRTELPKIIKNFEFRVINDAGCGDLNWISTLDLSGVDYMGYDLHALSAEEAAKLGKMKARRRAFQELDIVNDLMRPCDMVICKDVGIHLTNEDFLQALENFRAVTKFLFSTSRDQASNDDRIKVSGGFSPINLGIAPFNLGPPLIRIEEPMWDRFAGLWRL